MLGRWSRFALGSLLLGPFLGGAACSDDGSSGGSGGASGATFQGGSANGGSANGGKPNNAGGASVRGGAPGLGGGGALGGEGGSSEGGQAGASGNGASGGVEAAGGAGGESGAGSPSPLELARASYRSFSQRTAEPQPISAQIFNLCRLETLLETEFTKSVHGKDLYLLDWLDTEAQSGYAQPASPFPVGATIVKEKLVRNATGFEVAALGVMIKRAPGFDSAHGDWEFGYWEPESGMSSDAAYCGNCHANAATDFVFVDQSWHLQRP